MNFEMYINPETGFTETVYFVKKHNKISEKLMVEAKKNLETSKKNLKHGTGRQAPATGLIL